MWSSTLGRRTSVILGHCSLSRVQEVQPDKVILTIKDPKDKTAKPETVEIPAGFVLWSTGIGRFLHVFPLQADSPQLCNHSQSALSIFCRISSTRKPSSSIAICECKERQKAQSTHWGTRQQSTTIS